MTAIDYTAIYDPDRDFDARYTRARAVASGAGCTRTRASSSSAARPA